MILILLNTGDKSGQWLQQQLLLKGMDVFAVTPDEIITNKSFIFKMVDRQYSSKMELQNGVVIENEKIDGIINRVTYLPHLFQKTFIQTDADYVYQEWYAIYVSWLYSLRQKIFFNKPTTSGLAGEQYSLQEWILLAAKAGFNLFTYQRSHIAGQSFEIESDSLTESCAIVCFWQKCFVPDYLSKRIPNEIKVAALQLQELTKIEMIGIQIALTKKGWQFNGATPLPDLITIGNKIIPSIVERISMRPLLTSS